MEFDLLNEILTATVGQIFGKVPVKKASDLQFYTKTDLSSKEPFSKPANIKTNHDSLLKKSNSLNFGETNSLNLKKPSELLEILYKNKNENKQNFNENKQNFFEKKQNLNENKLNSNETRLNCNENKLNFNENKSYPNDNSIEKKLNFNENKLHFNENKQNFNEKKTISKDSSLEEQKLDSIKSKKKLINTTDIDFWLKSEGPALLQEGLKRLKINQNQIHKDCVEILSQQELEEKKKLVKNELKRYDFSFETLFNRNPIRYEKEPMRPLYIYYKLIKQFLPKEQESLNFDNKSNNGNNMNNEQKKNKKSEIPETNKMERPIIKISMNELKKRLEDLKKIKNDLRNKLHNYQQNFTKDNNRKIKYHKDISPVEEDYKRYKDLKTEICKLEEILNSNSARPFSGN